MRLGLRWRRRRRVDVDAHKTGGTGAIFPRSWRVAGSSARCSSWRSPP